MAAKINITDLLTILLNEALFALDITLHIKNYI